MDAETEEDMKAIGSILSELEGAFVLCGSGGLARALLDGETSHENYLRKHASAFWLPAERPILLPGSR